MKHVITIAAYTRQHRALRAFLLSPLSARSLHVFVTLASASVVKSITLNSALPSIHLHFQLMPVESISNVTPLEFPINLEFTTLEFTWNDCRIPRNFDSREIETSGCWFPRTFYYGSLGFFFNKTFRSMQAPQEFKKLESKLVEK